MALSGLLLPAPDNRLILVGESEPSTTFVEYGVTYEGTIVSVEQVNLTSEQIEMGAPMGYDAQTLTAILHPVLGPAFLEALSDAPLSAAQLAVERPQLKTMAQNALTSLAADQTQRAADVTALAAATTLAQVKPLVANMLSREQLRINVDIRVIRALAALAGVPL